MQASYLEQQSVQLAKDTHKAASELAADLIAMNGPYILKPISDTQLPGVHDEALKARADLPGYIEAGYTRPIPVPKYCLKSRHQFEEGTTRAPVPTHLVLDEGGRLSVLYSVGESQEVVPVLTKANVSTYREVVPREKIISSLLPHFTVVKKGWLSAFGVAKQA